MRHKFFKILLVALSLMCGMSAMAQSYISGEELRERVPKQLRDKYDYENFELAVYKKYTINKYTSDEGGVYFARNMGK